MNIAVKRDVAIPINKVVAKPFIGPVPNIYKTRAVKPVVIFASSIDERALLKPVSYTHLTLPTIYSV